MNAIHWWCKMHGNEVLSEGKIYLAHMPEKCAKYRTIALSVLI